MYRIRFHGRGGQGVKTASRILGSAFFLEDFEVQDAPRYGAERRGAPIFAYVRASRQPILERGVITHPDLVVVIDETLLALPAAGALEGITESTVLLVKTSRDPAALRAELKIAGRLLPFPPLESGAGALPLIAAAGAGAAARLTGAISEQALARAIA